jgi:hypothetical protein
VGKKICIFSRANPFLVSARDDAALVFGFPAAEAQFNSLFKLFDVAAHRQVAVMERAPESFDVVHLHPVDCFPTTSLYSDRPLFFFPAHTHCHGQFKKIHTRDSHCLSVDFHIQIRQAPVILRVDFLKRRKNRSFKYSTARQNCSCCVVTPSLFDPFNGITQKNMSISDRFTSNLVFHRKRTIDLEQKQNSR